MLSGTQPCPFIYILSIFAFVLQWQSLVVATETGPESLKHLLSSFLQKKVGNAHVNYKQILTRILDYKFFGKEGAEPYHSFVSSSYLTHIQKCKWCLLSERRKNNLKKGEEEEKEKLESIKDSGKKKRLM